MAKYTGGTSVKSGYYWNPRSWAVEVVPSEGGRLPADGASYLRIPFPLLFVVVPVLGALFLIFLPLIGFALFAWAIFRKITGGVRETATDLAATMSPGWAPGEAHLTGKAGEEKKGEASAELRKLESEIAEKRGDKNDGK
jgi:hypothetical protein